MTGQHPAGGREGGPREQVAKQVGQGARVPTHPTGFTGRLQKHQ